MNFGCDRQTARVGGSNETYLSWSDFIVTVYFSVFTDPFSQLVSLNQDKEVIFTHGAGD